MNADFDWLWWSRANHSEFCWDWSDQPIALFISNALQPNQNCDIICGAYSTFDGIAVVSLRWLLSYHYFAAAFNNTESTPLRRCPNSNNRDTKCECDCECVCLRVSVVCLVRRSGKWNQTVYGLMSVPFIQRTHAHTDTHTNRTHMLRNSM